MSLVAVPVGVDHRDFQAVDEADGVDPDFAVVETVVTRSTVGPSKICLASSKAILCLLTLARFFAASQVHRIECIYTM